MTAIGIMRTQQIYGKVPSVPKQELIICSLQNCLTVSLQKMCCSADSGIVLLEMALIHRFCSYYGLFVPIVVDLACHLLQVRKKRQHATVKSGIAIPHVAAQSMQIYIS